MTKFTELKFAWGRPISSRDLHRNVTLRETATEFDTRITQKRPGMRTGRSERTISEDTRRDRPEHHPSDDVTNPRRDD